MNSKLLLVLLLAVTTTHAYNYYLSPCGVDDITSQGLGSVQFDVGGNVTFSNLTIIESSNENVAEVIPTLSVHASRVVFHQVAILNSIRTLLLSSGEQQLDVGNKAAVQFVEVVFMGNRPSDVECDQSMSLPQDFASFNNTLTSCAT